MTINLSSRFTNTVIQTRTSSVARVVFSDASRLHCSNKTEQRTHSPSISVSWNRTFHTAHCRRTFRAFHTFAHGNRQHFCIGRRGSRGSSCDAQSLALDRHCSATMFGVFLHCTAVLSDHMGHPQPSLSGTGVLWVSTRTHRQDGIGDKAPTLWLLL